MKILVIKRDKIGDLLLTTPMLAHLRANLPDAEIHLLANDYNAWVAADNKHIDKMWVYYRMRRGSRIKALWTVWLTGEQLKRQKFDVVIVANSAESERAIDRGRTLGAPRVVACFPLGQEARYAGVTDRIDFDPRRHEVDAMIALLAPLGIAPPQEKLYPEFHLPAAWQGLAETWLAANNLKLREYVIISLGARRAKRQPTQEQVLRWSAWFAETRGLKTVFMWTPGQTSDWLYPGDDVLAAQILAAGSPHLVPVRGSRDQAIGLIWNSQFNVFPDSGMAHFAAASPGGVLALFADTTVSPHPDQWGPRGRRSDYLEAQKTVEELTDEAVYATINRLMAIPLQKPI